MWASFFAQNSRFIGHKLLKSHTPNNNLNILLIVLHIKPIYTITVVSGDELCMYASVKVLAKKTLKTR